MTAISTDEQLADFCAHLRGIAHLMRTRPGWPRSAADAVRVERAAEKLLSLSGDGARLDYYEAHPNGIVKCGGYWFAITRPTTVGQFTNIRAAIDAARTTTEEGNGR